jgi:glycosyltransferase involved in cell wall biosynthesis
MLDTIKIIKRAQNYDYKYSILIPTWNNLEFLQICIRSLRENSHFKHQIIIMINEGKDGSLEWIQNQDDIDYVHSEKNIGICYGLNSTRSLIKTDYVVYANDDMYFLPNWDLALENEIKSIGHDNFMLSSTMIEPTDTGNPCVIVSNYGESLNNFKEEKLLSEFQSFEKKDWNGSTWPPNIVPLKLWDLVGGMSVEFSPGFYSDPDLSMKLWQLGVRHFKGLANSRVYHFGSKSTKRAKMNKGKKLFLQKWGITSNFFTTKYLKRGENFSLLDTPDISWFDSVLNKIKKFL